YNEAKEALTNLVLGKTVYLDVDDIYVIDKYNRLVCVVYVKYNSTHLMNINFYLVINGYAVIEDYLNEFNPALWKLHVPEAKYTLPDFPKPFIYPLLNTSFVVGGTQSHGFLGWGAWTVDVLGGMLIASRLGHEAYSNINVAQIIDSDFIAYDPVTRSVNVDWSKISTSTLISIGSAGVNLLAYHYNMTNVIPFHFVFDGSNAYIYSELTGKYYDSEWGYDHVVIALVKDPEINKYVLLIFGVTGRGNQAASIVLSNYEQYPELLQGKAVIIKWQDQNGNNLPDKGETYMLIEIAP
ncbi:MAG: thermonuclease family protein, partial [Nitrososphaeria archaeon]